VQVSFSAILTTDSATADGKSIRSANEDSSDADDKKAQSLALRAAMKNLAASSANTDEGPPLTTKALRDLEKIKREIVFSETLIKIRYIIYCLLQNYCARHITICANLMILIEM
jgi:hypothetical protein